MMRIGGGHLLLAVLSGFLGWAAWFEIDETVRLSTTVVPHGRTQLVQAADGGVLERLYVSEGSPVAAGDLLARLESDRARAALEEIETQIAHLRLAGLRARAEAEGHTPDFGVPMPGLAAAVTAQAALYDQNAAALAQETAAIREAIALSRDEATRLAALFETGDVSRMRLAEARRGLIALERELAQAENRFRSDALRELAGIEEEAARLEHSRADRASRLAHTEIRAPQDGIVTRVAVNTIGGVMRPGDALLQILPTGAGTYLAVRIPPAEVSRLRLDMPASIRLDSFDYTIFGTMSGRLDYVSADSFSAEGDEGPSYYDGRIIADARQANARLPQDILQPGFTGTIDILTGRTSVIRYLFTPISRGL